MDLDFAVLENSSIRRIAPVVETSVRAEMFNILNRANFAPPIANETVSYQSGNPTAGAGSINEAATSSRSRFGDMSGTSPCPAQRQARIR